MTTKRGRAAKAKASKRKKKVEPDATVPPDESVIASLDPLRTGMPAIDSITGVEEFRKGKKVRRIIKTNEIDEYEKPPTSGRKK
jgi:hypothetical protein